MTIPMTTREREQIDAAKAAFAPTMTPLIDDALLQMMRGFDAATQAAELNEIARCIGIVERLRLKDPIPAPLSGWNEAIDHAVRTLRSWEKESAKPDEPDSPTSASKEGA